jgi:PAS domain S-box-containing protein
VRPTSLEALVSAASLAERLFDRIPDVVFFTKDLEGRYVLVNRTLVSRCGLRSTAELVGRTTREIFPAPLGERFYQQDLRVLESGEPITQNLELHLYPTRREGWCLTDKVPLRDVNGQVIGLAGISRDLHGPADDGPEVAEIAATVEHVRQCVEGRLSVEDMARHAGLSIYQLNRRLRMIFGITAGQFIIKTRIDRASEMLRSSDLAIADIAHRCGYFDQSAFSRVFRRTVGVPPGQYRARHRR